MDRVFLYVLTVLLLAASSPAAAQDRAVVNRLTEFGRMPSRDARAAVRAVNEGLAANANSGGDRYDRIRQAVGGGLFGSPGSTRDEYMRRLSQVLDRMRRGLDEQLLEALFPARENEAVLCANDFAVSVTACDSLVAAASRQRAALPYTAADDGSALQSSLREAGVGRREAREVATKLREAMLGIPRNLRRDRNGQAMLQLLEACPGALRGRESQIRAWHVGPTVGMARCIAQSMAGRLSPSDARQKAQALFAMSATAAEAFVGWARPATAAAPRPPPPAPAAAPSTGQLLDQARGHFRAQRFRQAAGAYEQAVRQDPTNARAFAGLGSAFLRGGRSRSAVNAYRQALSLAPGNAGFHALLGRALAANGDNSGAAASYRQALALQPNHRGATEGLRALGPIAPPRPPPPPAQAGPGPDELRGQARAHFQARRFNQAVTLYEQVTRMSPQDARAFAGLGASRLAMNNAAGAVAAYQSAVQLAANNSGYWTSLARAQSQANDRNSAVQSLARALEIDPNNRSAQQGMQALNTQGVQAGPQLPEVPSRDQIIGVMRPMGDSLAQCAPAYQGRVVFSVTIAGETGAVTAASMDDQELAASPEGECMLGIVNGAQFPRFSRTDLDVSYPFAL